jgi:2Fe-2S ferredoxin
MKIKFLPTGQEIEGNSNKTLLNLCQENGVHINSICKGIPKCAECRVKIVEGEGNILPPTQVEMGILGNNYYIDGRRLSCQVRAFGDIAVDLTEQLERDASAHKKVRGYRSQKGADQPQSHAVLDTFVLKK